MLRARLDYRYVGARRMRTALRGAAVLAAVLLHAAAGAQFVAPDRWYPVCVGVDYGRAVAELPRPLRAHFLRVDLRAPGLRFFATPSGGDPEGHTLGMTTSTFLSRFRLQAAINAAPFGPIHKEEGKPVKISGLTVCDGRVVSPPNDYPAILITRRNRVRIAEPPFDLREVHTAVSGFGIVLRDGVVTGKEDALHPRTAAGVTPDGRTLYLMVVDGRQPGYSEGITTAEVGEWLRVLGCSEGINLDGGGTSTLVIEDPARTPRIMNLPIHDNMPGRERVAGSHLGLRARRLPSGPVLPVP